MNNAANEKSAINPIKSNNETSIRKNPAKYHAALVFLLAAGIAFTPAMLTHQTVAAAVSLTVNSQDSSGNPITGYWTVISQGGATTQSGFTPISTSLSSGTYDIYVSDYGGYFFDHWSDGVSARDHVVSISADPITLTAVYATSPPNGGGGSQGPSITVTSAYSDGSQLSGMYTGLLQNGVTISTGFTPVTFPSSSGQSYTIVPQDYTNAYFARWSDGSTTREKTLTASTGTTSLTAIYTTSPTGSGGGISGENLVVNSVDSNGNSLSGYWTVISQGGSSVSMGFTPLSTNLPAGTYDISVGDYGGYYFNHWSDGATARDHIITLGSSTTTLTAVYSSTSSGSGGTGSGGSGGGGSGGDGTGASPAGQNSITVYAHRVPSSYWAPCFAVTCSAGTGPGAAMYVSLEDSSGNVIASGFADENGYSFTGLNPSAAYYLIYPADCDYCHNDPHNVVFSHWQDGSTTRPRDATLGQSYTAYFEYVPLS